MIDSETFHRTLILGDHAVKVEGKYLGEDFSALIDVRDKRVAWVDEPVSREGKHLQSVQSPKSKKSDCPGCGKVFKKLIRGGFGLLKSAMQIDRADDATLACRQTTCEACPSNCYDFGVCRDDWPDRCDTDQGCGCILSLKVLVASEECPHKHW